LLHHFAYRVLPLLGRDGSRIEISLDQLRHAVDATVRTFPMATTARASAFPTTGQRRQTCSEGEHLPTVHGLGTLGGCRHRSFLG
jgi:hypothetical protein